MVAGAFIAVSFIFINNVSTAAKGLLTKSRLSKHNFSSITLLFYNSIFMFPFMLVLALMTGRVQNVIDFPLWSNVWFIAGFLFSCLAAVTLQFLTFECTRLTSALTTSVIGVMKNTVVSFGGMFVGGDYIFTIVNFCGVTIRGIYLAQAKICSQKIHYKTSIHFRPKPSNRSTIGAITYGISMYMSKLSTLTEITPSEQKA
ncbi:hypothetical protein ACTXT7_009092 [Hymenolepis weldensis]